MKLQSEKKNPKSPFKIMWNINGWNIREYSMYKENPKVCINQKLFWKNGLKILQNSTNE